MRRDRLVSGLKVNRPRADSPRAEDHQAQSGLSPEQWLERASGRTLAGRGSFHEIDGRAKTAKASSGRPHLGKPVAPTPRDSRNAMNRRSRFWLPWSKPAASYSEELMRWARN